MKLNEKEQSELDNYYWFRFGKINPMLFILFLGFIYGVTIFFGAFYMELFNLSELEKFGFAHICSSGGIILLAILSSGVLFLISYYLLPWVFRPYRIKYLEMIKKYGVKK